MSTEKKQLGTQFTRALFDVTTINTEARTVDVVFATETPVMRRNWDGIYEEVLVCNSDNVRMQRLMAGAPLLDSHSRYSVTTQLGVVESGRIEKGEGRATIRFSKRDDVEKVWQDVIDKIVRGISVGYNVYAYEKIERIDNAIPVYRAIDWEPTEISLVPVPADMNSGIRSEDPKFLHEVTINNSNKNKPQTMTREAEIMAATRAAKLPDAFGQSLIDNAEISIDAARAAIIAEMGKVTAPPAPPAPVEDARAAVATAKKRTTDIMHAVRAAGFDVAFAETLINDDNISIDGARAAIITKLGEEASQANTRSANTATVLPGKEAIDKTRAAMTAGLIARVNPLLLTAEERTAAADFRGMNLMDMARAAVEDAGISVKGLSKREVAQLALNIGERQMSTSDFPNILGNTINRSLRQAYNIAGRTFTDWAVKKNATDFREMASVTLNELADLQKVVEGGEYKQQTMGEGAEKYKVAKYGTIINITWETLMNDDLGAFDRVPQKLATAAANTQSNIMYGILSTNAALADGVALFHATHGNLGSAAAISIASLSAAKAAMRKQKAPGKGNTFLNLVPKFLIVGPDKELEALQFTSTMYQPTTGAAVNPIAGSLTVIVDPRITDNSWYLSADPSAIDTVEYAFLDGEELFTEQRTGFEVDGMQTKVRMVFGAKAIDFRGLYKNPGA